MEIVLTSQELAAAQMAPAQLARAVRAVERDGYVILRDAVCHDHLDILRERMTADSLRLIAARKWGGAGRRPGHLQQGPPPFAPYVFRDIVANPFAVQVTHSILGDGMYNRFYNGNTNCPQSRMQPLHADAGHLWPGMAVAHPPASLIINVALMEVTPDNGSTELWPGTHMIPSDERRIEPETETRRRAVVPPVRANTAKGSLLIRDARLWHRGMPNHSQEIRHMIAMIHNMSWMQRASPLWYDIRCQDKFPEDGRLDHNARFTDQPLSYLYTRYPTPEPDPAAGVQA